jgi:hypothetical protein
VNNAISRVGPQLAGALIFVAISASFYAGLASQLPGVDTSSASFREQVSPLNRPAPTVPDEVRAAARQESGDSFALGMLLATGLLLLGATANWVGIRNPERAAEQAREGVEPTREPTMVLRPRPAGQKPPPCQHGPVPVFVPSDLTRPSEDDVP